MNKTLCLALALISAWSAYAQIDAFSLRSKYGPPLDRETFTVRPEIEIRVDYGPAKQACVILLPSGMTVREPSPDVITREQMKDVLDEVVPDSVRGKEIRRLVIVAGILSTVHTEYEYLSIDEHFKSGIGTGIVVTSKDPGCRKDSAQ
jgi:hypothetical protein